MKLPQRKIRNLIREAMSPKYKWADGVDQDWPNQKNFISKASVVSDRQNSKYQETPDLTHGELSHAIKHYKDVRGSGGLYNIIQPIFYNIIRSAVYGGKTIYFLGRLSSDLNFRAAVNKRNWKFRFPNRNQRSELIAKRNQALKDFQRTGDKIYKQKQNTHQENMNKEIFLDKNGWKNTINTTLDYINDLIKTGQSLTTFENEIYEKISPYILNIYRQDVMKNLAGDAMEGKQKKTIYSKNKKASGETFTIVNDKGEIMTNFRSYIDHPKFRRPMSPEEHGIAKSH